MAGEVIWIIALAILLPIYGLLLAGIFSIIFLAIATVVVPVGQVLADRYEEKHEPAVQFEEDHTDRREAA
jgi:hypothetical protein